MSIGTAARTAGLGTVIGTELYRACRGPLLWLLLLSSGALVLPMLVATALGADPEQWQGLTLMGWGGLLPAVTALAVGLDVREDADAWLFLLASPVSRARLVLGKMVALVLATAAGGLVLALALCGGALLSGAGLPVGPLAGVFAMWAALLGIAGLMLLLAIGFGFPATVGTGVVGVFAGMLTADKAFWFVNPFGWPLRAMLPFGRRLVGREIPDTSPLAATGPAIAAVLLSAVLAVATTALACAALERKQI